MDIKHVLFLAAKQGHMKAVQRLIEVGGDVFEFTCCHAKYAFGLCQHIKSCSRYRWRNPQ